MVTTFFNKSKNFILNLRNDISIKKYISHNRGVFKKVNLLNKKPPIILLELNAMQSAHIAYGYLANVLAKQSNAQIKAFVQKSHKTAFQTFLFKTRVLFGVKEIGVYRSFGVNEFIEISLSRAQKIKSAELFQKTIEILKSKNDVENLIINGVWIGDLVYDTYLMTYKKPTIDLECGEFKQSLSESLDCFTFWTDYLSYNDISAINVSHCSYTLAIPLRIAVSKDISVYQSNAAYIYRLNKENLFAYSDFMQFPASFQKLEENIKSKGLQEAERRINLRFSGEVGVDMAYSTKSAYGTFRHERLLKESSKTKVLIATHCFFDSPHSYGNNLFPDFFEWLEFLGKISEETDYDWYVKTHPDYLPGTMEIVNFFTRKFPKLIVLPADASHLQIVAEGIDVALTVYGTIGFEYAALGIPVINASLNNPHIAYNFNLHATDVNNYRKILLNLSELSLKIDKSQVYEYYFMKFIYNTNNIFFNDYIAMQSELGGYARQYSSLVYEKWLAEWTKEKHEQILSAIWFFIESKDFRMNHSHFGRSSGIESIVQSAQKNYTKSKVLSQIDNSI
jgi:hypothetical protein